LLLNGAKINICDWKGNTALHLASMEGYTMYVNLNLKKVRKKFFVRKFCPQKSKKFFFQSFRIVYQLLKRNAEKTIKNDEGKIPLDIAVEKCHADIVTLLVDKIFLQIFRKIFFSDLDFMI